MNWSIFNDQRHYKCVWLEPEKFFSQQNGIYYRFFFISNEGWFLSIIQDKLFFFSKWWVFRANFIFDSEQEVELEPEQLASIAARWVCTQRNRQKTSIGKRPTEKLKIERRMCIFVFWSVSRIFVVLNSFRLCLADCLHWTWAVLKLWMD